MSDTHLYSFNDREFRRIGCLLADRDAFIVFVTLASAPRPPTLKYLTSVLRREPSTVTDILSQLLETGLATRAGGFYSCTGLGTRVIGFLREVSDIVEMKPTLPESVPDTIQLSAFASDIAATNNTIVRTVTLTSWMKSGERDIKQPKPKEIATSSDTPHFESRHPSPESEGASQDYYSLRGNESRSYNHMR